MIRLHLRCRYTALVTFLGSRTRRSRRHASRFWRCTDQATLLLIRRTHLKACSHCRSMGQVTLHIRHSWLSAKYRNFSTPYRHETTSASLILQQPSAEPPTGPRRQAQSRIPSAAQTTHVQCSPTPLSLHAPRAHGQPQGPLATHMLAQHAPAVPKNAPVEDTFLSSMPSRLTTCTSNSCATHTDATHLASLSHLRPILPAIFTRSARYCLESGSRLKTARSPRCSNALTPS
jgi:hypothetical protein